MEVDTNSLLKIMAEKSTEANRLVDSQLEQAVAACKACSQARREYITATNTSPLKKPITETLKALADAGIVTVAGTGIGCPACIDLRDYVQSLVKQQEIEDKYASQG